MRSLVLSIISIFISLGILFWGLSRSGSLMIALILIDALLWAISMFRSPNLWVDAALLGNIVLSATTLWRNVPAVWLVICVFLGLLSWDLIHFRTRLTYAEAGEQKNIETSHLIQLILCSGLVILALLLASQIQIHVRFEWVMLLALVVMLAFTRIMKGSSR